MNLVIFGPPGAGKGTQSKFIVNKYDLYQLSTGDLLRNEINNKTQLGLKISSIINSGELVSNEIVGNLIEKFVSNNTYKNKIIFDGYPRTIEQAKNLDYLLKKYDQKIDMVLKLSVKKETVIKRILERQNQEKRADDNKEIAIKRFETYEKSSEPVINYYQQSNLIKVINGEASIPEINTEISGLIETIKG
ncbi:MAG: adenylate kinase [Pseudomonadota bacterium]|nr:adenylate kinase [Pseudomonadota bacterium]MEC7136440.1 adenylate kinase [Pseudomonadota bacterium]